MRKQQIRRGWKFRVEEPEHVNGQRIEDRTTLIMPFYFANPEIEKDSRREYRFKFEIDDAHDILSLTFIDLNEAAEYYVTKRRYKFRRIR